MTQSEFNDWVIKYSPDDVCIDEFVDKLALGSIRLIQQASQKSGLTIPELIQRFYFPIDGDSSLNN